MNIRRAFDAAVDDYGMIADGDVVLIGASGGKDSLALSSLLAFRADQKRPRFSIKALRVLPNEVPPPTLAAAAALADLYGSWNIPLEVLRLDPETRDAGTPRTCYRCAARRREVLMRYALDHGCSKIALGHHLDDILTTRLMNLVVHGESGGMPPLRRYDAFGVSLIRPLAYIPEETIRRYVRSRGWETTVCTCPAGMQGYRAEFRRRLEVLSGGSLEGKRKLFRGLSAHPSACGDALHGCAELND